VIARQAVAVTREGVSLARELARVAAGKSDIAPRAGDRRFADPAWTSSPVFRRLEQGYLASSAAIGRVVDELATSTPDDSRTQRARLAAQIAVSAAAPTNFLPTNPTAIKRALDTGGLSLLRGARNLVSDLRHNGGMPSTVDADAFEVGHNLAVSPGAVVARDEVAELLQYSPTTDTLFERPILVVPPPIGRYYFLDLAPGRSFVEHAVGQGLQTFVLSWRNPTSEQRDWNLDTYAARVLAAIDEVRAISRCDKVNLVGFCAGGLIGSTVLNYLAATGDDRVNSMTFAVTLLDFGLPAPLNAFSGARVLELVRQRSRRAGIIDSRQLGSAFAWLRPDDLVFNYWVNNYLLGERPAAFDILAWNADGTNLPGALHCEFLDIFQHNVLATPGVMAVLGTPVRLDSISLPTFVTGAVADHLTPWKGCYRTTQLLSGDSTFVLSYSGHIASLVNPPGNPRAHYWTGGPPGPDPDDWLTGAVKHQGSWWEPWADWVTDRAGDRRPAPRRLGNRRYPPLDAAPGRFVRDLPTAPAGVPGVPAL
jgi:polyhydroxyalkanoate synthase